MNNFKPPKEIIVICGKYISGYYDEFCRPCLRPRSFKKRGNYSHENPSYLCALFYNLIRYSNVIDAETYSRYYSKFLLEHCSVYKDGHKYFSRQPFGLNTYPSDHPNYDENRNWNTNSKDEYVGISSIGDMYVRKEVAEVAVYRNGIYDDYPKSQDLDPRYKHSGQNLYYYVCDTGYNYRFSWRVKHLVDRGYDKIMRPVFAKGIRANDKGKLIEKIRRPVADSVIKDFLKWGETKYLKWAIDYYFEDDGHPFKKLAREL